MKVYDLYSRFNQKQIKTIASISADNVKHLDLSYTRESNQFNETQNKENTVYFIWGWVTLHYPPIRPPPEISYKLREYPEY